MTKYEVQTEFGRYEVAANDMKITESGALAFYGRTRGSSRELLRAFSSWLSVKRVTG